MRRSRSLQPAVDSDIQKRISEMGLTQIRGCRPSDACRATAIYLAAILILDPRDRPRLCHGSQYFPSTKLRISPSIWRCLHGFGAVRGMQPYSRSAFPDRKLTYFLSRLPHVTLSVSSDPRDGPPWLLIINRDYSVRLRLGVPIDVPRVVGQL